MSESTGANIEETRDLIGRARASVYEFLRTELTLARTFVQVARSSRDVVKIQRNLKSAQKTLQAVKCFAARLNLQEWQKQELAHGTRDSVHVLGADQNQNPADAETR